MDVRDVSIPEPQDGELLIRVHPTRDFAFPFVTGMDGAGVVNELVRTTTQEKKRKEIQMNSSSNLLVLGATGQVGKLVATSLKRRKANFSVGSRREANLEELADQFGASRFIDLDDPRTFDEALKNVTGIFLITGYTVDMLVQSKSLIDAAKRNGVNHIVHLGAFTTDQDSYATVFAWHQMIEAYLRSSGVTWTNLHPNMFMQNLLTYTSIRWSVQAIHFQSSWVYCFGRSSRSCSTPSPIRLQSFVLSKITGWAGSESAKGRSTALQTQSTKCSTSNSIRRVISSSWTRKTANLYSTLPHTDRPLLTMKFAGPNSKIGTSARMPAV